MDSIHSSSNNYGSTFALTKYQSHENWCTAAIAHFYGPTIEAGSCNCRWPLPAAAAAAGTLAYPRVLLSDCVSA